MSEADERTETPEAARRGRRLVDGLVEQAVRLSGRVADQIDRADRVPAVPADPRVVSGAATAVAIAKAAGMVISSPISFPTLAVAARRTAADSLVRADHFGEHLRAIVAGTPTPLPAPGVTRLDGRQRWLITSDLHRCVPGRIDWPSRQQTKELYALMLEHYAEEGWGLVENGDVEDFWMVGGSTWGAVYDIARFAGRIAAPIDDSIESGVLAEQLDRIVENNERTYRVIREGFLADGRYHRTLGNHDEVLAEPAMAERLEEHLPGARPVDTVLMVDPGVGREASQVVELDDVMGVVTHGHLTDSWNGPGYSPLGRAITWLGLALEDLPTPAGTELLPDEEAVERLLTGRGRNRLISLDPRFGGNRRFDSLDEERLFAALAADTPEREWPWMMFGHTHYPMLWPRDRSGTAVKYANSGSGVLDGAVSALEWEPGGNDPVRLVLWRVEGGDLVRRELIPDGAQLTVGPPDEPG